MFVVVIYVTGKVFGEKNKFFFVLFILFALEKWEKK